MKKVYKHTCDRCHESEMEMTGTVIEDSFDAAMNPFRVFVTPDKFELWCDDCIEQFAKFCPTCIRDYTRPTHYYSPAYVKLLGGRCPFCELPLIFSQSTTRISNRHQACQQTPHEIGNDDTEEDTSTILNLAPTINATPPTLRQAQLLFRTPPTK